jgi:hypothetical protein
MQNAAIIHRLLGLAALAQHRQLLLQVQEFSDALIQMGYVLVKDCVDGTASFCRLIGQVQQGVYFLVTHVECPAISDETQALQMGWSIDPKVASSTHGLR